MYTMEVTLVQRNLIIKSGLFATHTTIEGKDIPKEVGREVTKHLKNFH